MFALGAIRYIERKEDPFFNLSFKLINLHNQKQRIKVNLYLYVHLTLSVDGKTGYFLLFYLEMTSKHKRKK